MTHKVGCQCLYEGTSPEIRGRLLFISHKLPLSHIATTSCTEASKSLQKKKQKQTNKKNKVGVRDGCQVTLPPVTATYLSRILFKSQTFFPSQIRCLRIQTLKVVSFHSLPSSIVGLFLWELLLGEEEARTKEVLHTAAGSTHSWWTKTVG